MSFGGGTKVDKEKIHELQATIKSLKMFINNSEAGMYVTDFYTGEILYANKKMVAIGSGEFQDGEELIGCICWELINPKKNGRCSFCPYKLLLGKSGEKLEPYTWEREFDDYGFSLKIISQAIEWSDGRLAQMNTFYDITETKKLQKELADAEREKQYRRMQQSLEGILDNLPTPVRITNRKTAQIMYVNKACPVMFDFPSVQDMIGLRITDMLPYVQNDGTDSREKIISILQSKETTAAEIDYLSATGSVISAAVTACLIDFHGETATLAILTDLTAEKERRKKLEYAAEKEREANKLKSTFLGNMSHEIRTPMNAIIGLTEIELHKTPTGETAEVYKKINVSARNLLEIVNDILDLSKIEADRLDLYPEAFELEEVIRDALTVIIPRLERRPVELLCDFSLDLPRFVVGDKTRLWQILKNYLDNAVKFTSEGIITLSVKEEATKSAKDNVYISFGISDTGIGMDERQLEKVFAPYEQIKSDAQKRFTGTGLGLPLSKRICELMGGEIFIQSSYGKGTTIRSVLPFGLSMNNESWRDAYKITKVSSVKVLAIDSGGVALKSLGEVLTNSGADFVTVRDDEEALRIMGRYTGFDIALLNYCVGKESGLKIAKTIREQANKPIKIIVAASSENNFEKEWLEEYEIDGVIEKNAVPSVIIEKMKQFICIGDDEAEVEGSDYARFENINILICEDNALNQLVAAGMLDQFGIEPEFADNGKLGVEALYNGKDFDLVFMDLHMPVMDGYEATLTIRQDKRFADMPIIGLTADAMSEVSEKCIYCGMNDYLSKPYVMDDFYNILVKWLPKSKIESAKN